MKRRLPPHKPIAEGKVYWPGRSDYPNLVVDADRLQEQCKRHMAHIREHEDWRKDPTYNLRSKGRIHR